MAYIAVSDLQKKTQFITLSTTSNPTSAQVLDYIAQVEAAMNSRFNAVGITTPVTDSTKLLVVQRIAINGTLAEVFRSIDQDVERAAIYQKLFDDEMKIIEKNPEIIEETSAVYAAPAAQGAGDDERPFRRGEQDW